MAETGKEPKITAAEEAPAQKEAGDSTSPQKEEAPKLGTYVSRIRVIFDGEP